MESKTISRRDLIKKSALGLGLIGASGLAACSKKDSVVKNVTDTVDSAKDAVKDAATGLSYVSESDSMAKNLGYKEDASTVDASIRAQKGKIAGTDQLCTNCQFYKAVDSQNGEGGTCTLFPKKYVKANGWCKSWTLTAQK